jgi:hypothetical protein
MSDKPIPPAVAEHALQACLTENGEQIGMSATIAQQAELIRLQEDKIQRQAAELFALKMPGALKRAGAGGHVPDSVFQDEFQVWWEDEGQYVRSGGGTYERFFAFQAWRHLYPMLMQARARLNASRDVVQVAYRVTGAYTDCAFTHKSSAEAYLSGLLSSDPDGGYQITGLYAAPTPAPDNSADDKMVRVPREPMQGEAMDPFAWAEFDGEGGYDLRLYENNEDFNQEYVERNGEKYSGWVMPLYTAPPSLDAELVGLLTGLVEIASKRNRGRRGSPNHGHSMPGIWDSDNGDLAGKPCAECALYDLAVDKLADLRKEAP